MKIRSIVTLVSLATAAVVGAACGPGAPAGEIRDVSEGMRFSITADSLPPRAGDLVVFRVSVRDAKTGEPIQGGQGRIWGVNKDMHKPDNGFADAPQLGTYLGAITLITAGKWYMSIQFRRDSLSPFARVDWTQEVRKPLAMGGN